MRDGFDERLRRLRTQAEARLEKASQPVDKLSGPEIKDLIHDYQVHQIELEIQNEELRETQKQLELVRDRYARLFNDAPVGYLTIDETGIIVQTNETFAGMVGREPAYLSGKALADCIDPTERSAFYGRFKAFFKNPQGKHLDFRLHGQNGGPTVRCVGRMEKESQDQPAHDARRHLLLILTDISEQVRAEAARRESEERYRLLSDVTLEGIVIHKNGVARDLNPSLSRLFGYERDEILGVNILELIIHEEDRDIVRSNILKEYAQPYTVRAVKKSGEVFFAELEARNFVTRDETLRVAAVRDITPRKLAEREIAQINEQLRQAVAEKDMLFAIIAHDLKSPMSGLVVSTEMLAREPEIFSEQDFGFLATALHKNARNTFNLLEDLLQWARMSQGGIDFEPTPTSLDNLLHMGLSTAKDLAKGKEISLRVDIPPGLTVLVDQPMIKTVIRNVLFNAVKFTPRRGEIAITARLADRKVTMAIQDNGIGMSEQVLSSVFTLEKGKRQLGTDGEKGTGLGLVLCKQFIEKHGGRIRLESRPGHGTTVYFTLPEA
ncbi:PAS domain S-box-containing protein [Desulfonatronum zhilinae]|nr:PAS domain S-box-containing protein [Desulfonatronum zhilinae]